MIDRALPMPRVMGRWSTGSKYPDIIWVAMSDGTRQAYERKIVQPGFHERQESQVGYRRKEGEA